MTDSLTNVFFMHFEDHGSPPGIFFAPGRVNLIGEHTDYNDGYVFPCALSYGTRLAIRPNNLGRFRFASENFSGTHDLSHQEIQERQADSWVNYPLGVFDQFIRTGISFPGYDLLFSGDIPAGAGLSSSAAIEVVTAFALNELENLSFEKESLARLCQRAENEFVGMNCGIMDQFASALSVKGQALFLNCATLAHVHVPLRLEGISLVIANTNKRRDLVHSKYNERRAECELAVKYLSADRDIGSLGRLHWKDFEKRSHLIPEEHILRRARHVVSEDMRTLEAVKALHQGNIKRFGELMYESHASLRNDFEVSCEELDILVEEAAALPGTLGARMTGGGFGGCTVNLVEEGRADDFIRLVGENYQRRSGLRADFYIAATDDGVRQIR